MGEGIPRVAVLAVILPDGPPLPLTQVWAPFFPRHLGIVAFPQTCAFGRRVRDGLLILWWLFHAFPIEARKRSLRRIDRQGERYQAA